MARSVGDRLGRYEIMAPLGAGGMGEVYRARDERLDRDVAVKVLPEEVAQDEARLARFEREAKLLASLNHQNIATLYGLEEHEGQRFLVMELAEGETLAERIKKGAIPVDDALPIALQIAEGLEAAHEQGIIHRDLKPANVMLSPEGKLKILDFGLAKAWAPEESDADLTHSPTLTAQMTAAGVLLGTAAYMSPEQARGKPVDKRADIWAFGVILFEMLTGQRAFQGETVTDVLAKIVERDPDWKVLPPQTPRKIRELLRRSLHKNPHHRLHDIADARIVIQEALDDGSAAGKPGLGVGPTPDRRVRRVMIVSGLVGAIVGAALVAPVALRYRETTSAQRTARFTIPPPAADPPPHGLALSPDGTQLVWATSRLYLRPLNELDAVPIPDTEGGASPFFSPDGEWIGFISGDGRLSKIPIKGGPPIPLADAYPGRTGASWGVDDSIVFTNDAGGISRISATGGKLAVLVTPSGNAGGPFVAPQLLPEAKALIYCDYGTSRVVALRLDTGESIQLTEGSHPHYLPTGHLFFLTERGYVARRFDPARLEFAGAPMTVVADVVRATRGYPAPIAASETGSLAYVPLQEGRLVWVDKNGAVDPVTEKTGPYTFPRLSPDQRRIAVSLWTGASAGEIWLYDLQRDAFTRLTLPGESHSQPRWTPDGDWITATSLREGRFNLFSYAADGSGRETRLINSDWQHWGGFWSPDGRFLAFVELHPQTGGDIWVQEPGVGGSPHALFKTAALENGPAFSPDGRFLAYTSDESGRSEVYVTAFPEVGARIQVSTHGGVQPLWDPDGRAIYYLAGDRMMAVPISYLPTLDAGKPQELFSGSFEGMDRFGHAYDITADGERFLMVEADPAKIVVVLNWFEELKRLVPTE